MFERIFRAPRTLRRHRQEPLADERARYLAQLAENGVSRSTLRHAAFFLLDFAARIDLRGDQKVSQEQIDRAVPEIAGDDALGNVQAKWLSSFADRALPYLGHLSERGGNLGSGACGSV